MLKYSHHKKKFDKLIKEKEDIDKEINKMKNIFEIERDYRDEEVNGYVLEIRKNTQKHEEFMDEVNQNEILLKHFNEKIDKLKEEQQKIEDKIPQIDKLSRKIDGEIGELNYEIIIVQDKIKPFEERDLYKLNEDTSIVTSSLQDTYKSRQSRMSKKESFLTNGSLKSTKKGFPNSVIESSNSRKSTNNRLVLGFIIL